MGEMMGTTLYVGGKMTAAKAEKVKAAVNKLYYSTYTAEWDDKEMEAANEQELPAIWESEQNYGDTREIEKELRGLGVAYCVHVDGKYEYGSCVAAWRPGWESVRFENASQDGHVAPTIMAIDAAIKDGGLDHALSRWRSIENTPGPLEIVEEARA